MAANYASNDEVDAVFERVVSAGATPVRAPQPKDWGGYSGYVADPDGYLREIACNPSQRLMRLDAAGTLTLTPSE